MDAKTALVVEDDKSIQTLLREALEGEGFQVTCEKDGEWALKTLERRLPDVLVTDVLLPTLSGFDLIEALRAAPGGDQVPVIVISGIYRGARHKRLATEKLKVAGYLDKPFEISALLARVQDALGDDYPGRRRKKSAKRLLVQDAAAATSDPLAGVDTRKEREDVEREAKEFGLGKSARGNLKHKRFPEVLSQLYRWRATGALLLRRDRVKKIVYLKEGYPIFVKSNLLSECLGRILVREKMITEKECAESLEKMKQSGRQQGTVLIEMGCISPHNLVYGLQLQLEAKLFDIFGWPDGDYLFNPKIDIPPQAVHLDMSLATILYEGVRRGFSEQPLKDLLAPFLDAYLGVHPDPLHRFQEVSLEADERKLVALIDGRRTTAEIIERSGLPEAQARQLVYALLAAEMVQPQPKRARKKDALELPPPPLGSRDKPPPLRKKDAGASDVFGTLAEVEPRLPPASIEELSVDELRARLTSRVRAMRRMNHFEALGVSRSASEDEVRKAYFALVREVHPDRLAGAPADAKALASQIHGQLTAAYETLSEKERRAAYEQKLEEGTKTGVSDEVGRVLAAEGRFRRGEQALAKGEHERAKTLFEEAVDLYADEGEFHTHLGWALFLSAPGDAAAARTAEAHIEEGIRLNPRADKGYLFLGRLLKEMGRTTEAVKQFEQAIQCNPDCKEALAELSLISASA